MITDKQNQSLINGLALAQNAPKISHLFFADDSLIFCKANKEEASHLKAIFEEYQRISGQLINMEKSEMSFSPRLYQHIKDDFQRNLPLPITNSISKYLGMPTQIGRSKQAVFKFILDKVKGKLKGWKEKHLSFAGRAVLISAVVQALPTYVMSCFMIPKNMCAQIEKEICRFWWGSTREQHKIHWKARKDLFQPKFKGGLGFRDMFLFNKAMLAKQVWRLHSDPNSLVGQCFSAKYYPNTNIFQSIQGRQSSYAWQSIHQAIELIHKGSCWKIGNGHSVNIWEDNWLVYQNGYKIITPQAGHNNITKVKDIMTFQPNKCWNHDLIDQIFLPFEGTLIKQIPLIMEPIDDQLMWPHSKQGTYTVKSGYNLLNQWKEAERPGSANGNAHNELWKKLWTLHTVPRHKVFLWRVLQGAIPVRSMLNIKGVQCNILCPRCLEKEETIDHAFMKCQFASRIWFGSKLGVNFNNNQIGFIEWLTHAINNLNKEDISYVAAIAYSIWFARNQQVFNLTCIDDDHVINCVNLSIQDYTSALNSLNPNKSLQSQHSSTHPHRNIRQTNNRIRWARPNNGVIKMNCDANLTIDGSWGLGAIYRDSEGAALAAATWVVPGSRDPTLAEAWVLYKAVLLALDCGFFEVECESDNTTIVSYINDSSSKPRSYVGNMV
jgi:hypothetical protein